MTEASELPTPPPAAHPLATALARPKLIAVGCVIALAALGWLYLAFAVADMGGAGAALGPGMTIFDSLPRAVQTICRPLFGESEEPSRLRLLSTPTATGVVLAAYGSV